MDDLDFPGWEPAKSVQVVEGNGLTQVLVKGQPYMRWQSGDEGCTRLAIVQLYKCGLGTEEDLAKKRGTPSRSQKKEVMDDIAVIEGKILLADDQLEKLPSEIRFDEAYAGEKLLKLNHEKKRFLDCIKVFVCNSRAEMCRLLLKHYDRPKEVIPALAMIVERTGYMKLEGGRLEVTLRRFTDREIDYAARHLCEDLNRMQPVTLDKFHLPIRYHIQ